MRTAEDVLQFWFVDHGRGDWFGGKSAFDAALAEAFADTHARVARGEAWQWRATPRGRLAEIIVLDQFSRQLHRGMPQAFAQDPMALTLAQEVLLLGLDDGFAVEEMTFLLLPFMHSESIVIQAESMRLHEKLGIDEGIDFASKHRDAVARFGRFPFRNKALGRQSTPEEIAYIAEHADRGF